MSLLKVLFGIHPRRQLRELYLFSVLFSFASSLITIFEPIFFFKEGFPLWGVMMYYAVHYTFYVFALPLGGKFVARFGTERSLALAMPLFVGYFLMLAVLPEYRWLVYVAWIVMTVFKVLYWPAYHTEVATFGDRKNRGTELSWLYALTRGVGVLGPLIGGLVIVWFGFQTLFVLAAGMAVVATVPLLRTKERFKAVSFSYTQAWRIAFARRNTRMRLAMVGWGENLIALVVWPIFMFVQLGSTDILGYLASASVLLVALFGFVVGEVSDRLSRRFVLRLHVPFMVIGYLLRHLATTPVGVLLTDMLGKASFIGVRLPMWHLLYTQSKREGELKYIISLEMVLALSKACTAYALVVIFWLAPWASGFPIAFALAAALSLFYFFL